MRHDNDHEAFVCSYEARPNSHRGKVHRPARNRLLPEGLERRELLALVISEVHYAPHAAVAALGESAFAANDFEFLEIQNAGATATNLAGTRLTQVVRNGAPEGVNFTFGNQSLAPGARVVVARNAAAFRARYGNLPGLVGEWTGGSLSNQGELLTLADATGAAIHQFIYDNNYQWPYLADGHGASLELVDAALDPTLPSSWQDSLDYGGTPGRAASSGSPRVLINEVLSHTDEPLYDSIELKNISNTPIDLSGWFLSDRVDAPMKFMIPAGTVLAPGGYLVFDERQFNRGQGALPNDFGISEYGEQLYLLSPDGNRRPRFVEDMVIVGATDNGVSVGNLGDVRDSRELLRLTARSLGAANGRHEPSPVVISEVHYHPPSDDVYDEFIELHNWTAAPVDISGWEVVDAVDILFPANTVLPAKGYVVLVAFDPQDGSRANRFREQYGLDSSVRLLGPWSGNSRGEPDRLSNSSERLSLRYPLLENGIPYYALAEFVYYHDTVPWPIDADSQGASIARVDVGRYSNDAASWVAARPTPGGLPFRASTADLLELDRPRTESIGTDGAWLRGGTDVDFFRFLAPEDGEYVLRAAANGMGGLAPELTLYAPGGREIARAPAVTGSTHELKLTLTGGLWYMPTVSAPGSFGPQFDAVTGIGVQSGPSVDYTLTMARVIEADNPLHHATLPEDVNQDGVVSPLDALLVINELNLSAADGEGTLASKPDVNNDRKVTPIDALLIINYLNDLRQSAPLAARAATWQEASIDDRPCTVWGGSVQLAIEPPVPTPPDSLLPSAIDQILAVKSRPLSNAEPVRHAVAWGRG